MKLTGKSINFALKKSTHTHKKKKSTKFGQIKLNTKLKEKTCAERRQTARGTEEMSNQHDSFN